MTGITLDNLIAALYSDQIQELEDVFYPLLCRLDVNNMTGQPLRNLAALVGQNVTSLDDTEMRILIQAKIAENNSTGDFESLYNVFYLLSQASPATTIRVKEFYPAVVEFQTSGTIPAGFEQITFDALKRSVAAGVRVKAIRSTYTENGWFRFGPTSYLDSGFNKGKLGTSIIK
jgi:hypothetical protein